MQEWRSRPPCSGRPVNGSGFGSSIKCIISEPTHNQAPLYGSLSCGLASFIVRPDFQDRIMIFLSKRKDKFIIFKARMKYYQEYFGKSVAIFQDSRTRSQHGEHQQLQSLQEHNHFCQFQRRYPYWAKEWYKCLIRC